MLDKPTAVTKIGEMRKSARVLSWLLAMPLLLAAGGVSSCISGDQRDESGPIASTANGLDGDIGANIDLDDLLAAGLVGSKHDFTESLKHPRDLCTPCHVPHITSAKAPLLDSRPASADRLRPYEAFGVDLDSSSLLCLSCHDGVIAKDVYTASHATQWVRQLRGSRFGTTGSTGHPIGVRYPLSEPTYHSISAVTADGRIKLPDGRVQCISCHDPHNTRRHSGMLVRSDAGSRLCLACHRL